MFLIIFLLCLFKPHGDRFWEDVNTRRALVVRLAIPVSKNISESVCSHICIHRESNPGYNLGRVAFYH